MARPRGDAAAVAGLRGSAAGCVERRVPSDPGRDELQTACGRARSGHATGACRRRLRGCNHRPVNALRLAGERGADAIDTHCEQARRAARRPGHDVRRDRNLLREEPVLAAGAVQPQPCHRQARGGAQVSPKDDRGHLGFGL